MNVGTEYGLNEMSSRGKPGIFKSRVTAVSPLFFLWLYYISTFSFILFLYFFS